MALEFYVRISTIISTTKNILTSNIQRDACCMYKMQINSAFFAVVLLLRYRYAALLAREKYCKYRIA